jgi:hypothetical protein
MVQKNTGSWTRIRNRLRNTGSLQKLSSVLARVADQDMVPFGLGCALTFASEAKFEIEAKISFRLEAKKSLISHDSLRCETPKI